MNYVEIIKYETNNSSKTKKNTIKMCIITKFYIFAIVLTNKFIVMKKVLSMILTVAFLAGLSSCGRECVCKGKDDGDKYKVVVSKKAGDDMCKGLEAMQYGDKDDDDYMDCK